MMRHLIFTAAIAATLASIPLELKADGWNEMATLARPGTDAPMETDNRSKLQRTSFTNALFLDYDNDGNLDLLIMAKGGDWITPMSQHFLLLYHNTGADEDYTLKAIPTTTTELLQEVDEAWLNPVCAADLNSDGYTDLVTMSYNNGRMIHLYINDSGSGHFIHTLLDDKAVTNGALSVGDIDNDGLVDILATGWSDERGADGVILYRNLGLGQFERVVPNSNSNSNSNSNNITGAYSGQSTLADLNGDGLLDAIVTGYDSSGRCAKVFIGNGDFTFTPVETSLVAANNGNVVCADFNVDGIMDIASCGDGQGGTKVRLNYGTSNGDFLVNIPNEICPINTDGAINLGDWDGDGSADLIVGGYLGSGAPDGSYSTPLRIYRNTATNNLPTPPSSVEANVVDGYIEIEWTAGSDGETATDALRYNIMLKNDDNGETFFLIPANPETGALKVGTDLYTSVSSKAMKYRVKSSSTGNFTVGVSTLDQSWAGSPFTSVKVETGAGLNPTKAQEQYSVLTDGNQITVTGPDGKILKAYTADGRVQATFLTNEPVSLHAPALYFLTDGNLWHHRQLIR